MAMPLTTNNRSSISSAGIIEPTNLVPEVDAVLGPSCTKDTTIHFELSIEEDARSILEDLSRLRCLGNFALAGKCFGDYFQRLPLRYQFCYEYCDMLLEQGAYEQILDFLDPFTENWLVSIDRLTRGLARLKLHGLDVDVLLDAKVAGSILSEDISKYSKGKPIGTEFCEQYQFIQFH